jgi:hypothetical protein
MRWATAGRLEMATLELSGMVTARQLGMVTARQLGMVTVEVSGIATARGGPEPAPASRAAGRAIWADLRAGMEPDPLWVSSCMARSWARAAASQWALGAVLLEEPAAGATLAALARPWRWRQARR